MTIADHVQVKGAILDATGGLSKLVVEQKDHRLHEAPVGGGVAKGFIQFYGGATPIAVPSGQMTSLPLRADFYDPSGNSQDTPSWFEIVNGNEAHLAEGLYALWASLKYPPSNVGIRYFDLSTSAWGAPTSDVENSPATGESTDLHVTIPAWPMPEGGSFQANTRHTTGADIASNMMQLDGYIIKLA